MNSPAQISEDLEAMHERESTALANYYETIRNLMPPELAAIQSDMPLSQEYCRSLKMVKSKEAWNKLSSSSRDALSYMQK